MAAKDAKIPPEMTHVFILLSSKAMRCFPMTCPNFIMQNEANKAATPAVNAPMPTAPPAAPPAMLFSVIGIAILRASRGLSDFIVKVEDDLSVPLSLLLCRYALKSSMER